MKKAVLSLVILSALLILPIVSAELLVSELDDLYNAGDQFDVSILMSPDSDTTDFLTVDLSCGSDSVQLYKNPHSIYANEEKIIDIATSLDLFIVEDLEGSCRILASYGSEKANSDSFILSKNIKITSSIDKQTLSPSESFIITGNAEKDNGDLLSGYIEITSSKLDINEKIQVTSGSFNFEYTLPQDSPAGSYSLSINAYEKNQANKTLNTGFKSEPLIIRQIPSSIEIALNDQSLIPGTDLEFKPLVLDQSGIQMEKKVQIVLSDSENKVFYEAEVTSGSFTSFSLPKNSTQGEWKISASSNDLEESRFFIIEPLESLNYEVSGDLLYVQNDGNALYKKPLEVSISGKKETFDIDLKPGEYKVYRLSAPTGAYEVTINSGDDKRDFKATLTGSAIDVKDITSGSKSGLINLALWIVIILVIIFVVYYSYRKYFKSSLSFALPKKIKSVKNTSSKPVSSSSREKSEIIVLNIKNSKDLENYASARSALESALLIAKKSKAKIYTSENYRMIILSPSITRKEDNSAESVSISRQIKEILDEFNRNSKIKISYGLGINSGEMVAESSNGLMKYTSIGTTVSQAKSIAHDSDNEILISEELHRKLAGKIRTEKISPKIWKVQDLKSKYRYNEFVDKFHKRK